MHTQTVAHTDTHTHTYIHTHAHTAHHFNYTICSMHGILHFLYLCSVCVFWSWQLFNLYFICICSVIAMDTCLVGHCTRLRNDIHCSALERCMLTNWIACDQWRVASYSACKGIGDCWLVQFWWLHGNVSNTWKTTFGTTHGKERRG